MIIFSNLGNTKDNGESLLSLTLELISIVTEKDSKYEITLAEKDRQIATLKREVAESRAKVVAMQELIVDLKRDLGESQAKIKQMPIAENQVST